MKFLKSHFALSRSQQNGIFILVIIIVILQVLIFSLDSFPKNTRVSDTEEKEILEFRRLLDSVKDSRSHVKKDTIYPFNPNYITDFKGYQLGMSVKELDRLLDYRKSGRWINSKEDFHNVTGISDSLMTKIGPSLRFPQWIEKTAVSKSVKINENLPVTFSDLNTANVEDLKSVNGIGEVLSERIVKYRYRIGGFRDVIQLNDVYGLSPEVIVNILKRFQVISKPDAELLNLNISTAAQLAEIPYFNEELARRIVSYRKLHERIISYEELSKIQGFPYDKIDRIKLYLAIE